MTKWNKAIQCEQIWWLIIAYTVKLTFSTSTYQCSFSCVDHWGLHASRTTSYFPPIRFIDQKAKIPPLQRSDEFSFGFEIIYPRDIPRTETVAKFTEKKSKKYTPDIQSSRNKLQTISRRRRISSTPHIYARRNQNKWPDQWPMSIFLFYHKTMNGTYQTQFAGLCKEHREPESMNNLQFTLAEFACNNSLAFSGQNSDSSWESWLQNPMKFYQSLWGFKKAYNPFQQRNYHKIKRTHYAPHGGNLWHRAQRSEVRAERLVFLAKDNRHNLLRTCVTRVTYIFTAGQITVGS